ncbi:stalk domain-containing protein [Saccharibacillus sp. CPCC 101409]|uniref:stalk domain-containing protein n=1 Tax=Saccharibacillus sp. CPCC 101409 TaxID=3058041 RepID=UPI0026722035|nr:stalk domain-containing protein [Saccharibacillus sp. CPCC 101409]MDO3411663.1 stalk domain-containing protein [Saccharibacillus sp. CPCC 101409]
MNKKISAAVLAGALLVSGGIQHSASAATTNIKVFIDGVQLKTAQPPILQGNRALAPLRSIFEALDADVNWNQKAKTVTAKRGGDTISLKIGSKTATVNGSTVTLDVPASVVKGSTVVPLRFISESLGQDVKWDKANLSVLITTTPDLVAPTSVSARNLGQYGDGRDLQVAFNKAPDEAYVQQYRVFVVKSEKASSFTSAAATQASKANNYTAALPTGSNQTLSLSAQAKDTDGETLKSGQAYQVYVMAVGNEFASNQVVLSTGSSAVTLSGGSIPSSVRATDTGDSGDGRDLTVTFNKASDESKISGYRVLVVKTSEAGSFNLSAANAVTDQNATTVAKGAASPSVTLTAQSRDTSGNPIQNGVPYTVFVLGVDASGIASNNTLSSASASVTLNTAGSDVSATNVAASDISDYGDARDLRVTFNKAANEANISQYRVVVVKDTKASSFNINSANALSSANYTTVSKTGSNLTQTLNAATRDSDGDAIRNGTAYRVFVLTVGSGTSSSTNVLSSASQVVTLGGNNVGTPSTPVLSDSGNAGDGRDLQVTFSRASDESSVSEYRVLIVKSGSAGNFNLASAISVPSANYTPLSKTGGNQSIFLNANSRDVNGEPIRDGVAYRAFVLAVGSNASNGNANYALSGVSNTVTLSTNNSTSPTVTNVTADVNSSTGNASDVTVTFSRPSNEDSVSGYRILAVPASQAGSFTLSNANATSNYTTVSKNGTGQIRQTLSANSQDVNGNTIANNGTSYRFFVLTVSNNGANTLSGSSNEVSLREASVQPATNVNASGNGQTATVSFSRPTNDANIASYRVVLVPSSQASNFTVANAQQSAYSKTWNGSNVTFAVNSDRDAYGNALQANTPYRAFVLSVANGNQATGNALSDASNEIYLTN